MGDAISGENAELEIKPGLADLIEIFYAPSAVFARRRESGKFGMALLVLVVVGLILVLATRNLVEPATHADLARGMQQAVAAKKMTAEQAQASVAFSEKVAPLAVVVYLLVAPFVAGVVIWGIGRLTDIKQRLGVAVMIGVFAMFPRLIAIVMGAILALVTPEGSLTGAAKLSLGPAHFVDVAAHPGLAQMLTRVDVFMIWSYILVGIGIYVTARSTKAQAWSTAILTWAVLSLPALWGAMRVG